MEPDGQQDLRLKQRGRFVVFIVARLALFFSYCGVLGYLYYASKPSLLVAGIWVALTFFLIRIWYYAFRRWLEKLPIADAG